VAEQADPQGGLGAGVEWLRPGALEQRRVDVVETPVWVNVSTRETGGQQCGALQRGFGDQVVDLQAADPNLPSDLRVILQRNNGDLSSLGDLAKRAPASARRPLKGLKYALPVANPGKVVCLGLNYLEHVKEGPNRDNIPKFPTLFMRGMNSFVSHGQALMRPKVSETFDYEAELVVVIGKRAKHLTMENAASFIAGYTCSNEGSIREFQRHTTQWHAGKNFDKSGSIGPWMVTADELPTLAKGLKIESRVNGKVMQSDNTDNMMFPIAESLGIHEIHYAMVIVVAMNIGLMTPPIGIGFYLACRIGNVSPDDAIHALWPYILALLAGLALIAAVPAISTGVL